MPLSTAQKLNLLLGSGSYASRVLSTGPVALWPLSEAAGATSVSDSAGGFTGTPSNVTFGAATFPDGTLAPSFNGTTSHVATYSAGLASALNFQEGTMACWLRVANAGVWTDGSNRFVYDVFADGSNRIRFNKATGSNTFTLEHRGGGTARTSNASISTTAWFHLALTWSSAGSAVLSYVNGVSSSNLGAPGTYAGSANAVSMAIGKLFTSDSANGWSGNVKYFGLWPRALSAGEIANLYVPGYAI